MQTIHSEDQGLIIKTLVKRIEQLEQAMAVERQQEGAAASIRDAVRYLRLHDTILLHIGDYDYDGMREKIAEHQGTRAAFQAIEEVWFLNKAPLAPDVVTALREAANHGMCRW